MKKNIRTFLLKCSFIILPLLLLSIYYYLTDPFKVIHRYEKYDQPGFVLNSNVVGWNTYLNNKDTVNFNSFILGNSCTMAFKCTEWEKYLDNDDRAIRLFGPAESLTAMYYKLRALDEAGADIKNLLLILDYSVFNQTVHRYNVVHILPPDISGDSDFDFQACFIKTFLTPKFFISYLDYNLFHKYRRYMHGVINPYKSTLNGINCDFYNPLELEIEKKKEQYWIDHLNNFKTKKALGIELSQIISITAKGTLEDIAAICNRHNTNIKVIITPNFYRQKLNKEDVNILESIFGAEHVWDFSKDDAYSEKVYFYEKTHFRPLLGEVLMKKIYCEVEQK